MTSHTENGGKHPEGDHLHLLFEELERIKARNVCLSLDECFEPKAGVLLKVEIGSAYWHMWPKEFQALLREIPDCAGDDAVQQAIEYHTTHVWHGPSPKGSRDTSY